MSVFLILPATVAYASFFSIFSEIFTKVSTQAKPINSQNIALLAATGGPDLGAKNTGSDINTVDRSALLPDAGPAGAMADLPSNDFDHGQISIYVVREGDSLSSIGKMFDVSVNTIVWANNMARGAKLTVGQTLVILPVSGVEHTVKKGDTIESISKKYRADPDEVRSYNGFAAGDILDIGAVVIVPDGEIQTAIPVQTKPASSKLRGASSANYVGYYQAPLANYRKTQGLHGYNGVDLTQFVGAPVMAAASGDVIVSRQGGYNGGYGNYVVIQHDNGTQTLYAHLQSTAVTVGQRVGQGATLGFLGNSGRSTGPHLHFEIRGAKNPF